MKLQTLTIVAAAFGRSHAFNQSQKPVVSRRDAVSNTLASIVAISLPTSALAIDRCPPGSKNCLRQTWTPPSSTSAADATTQLRDALNSYSQEGQVDEKVDLGGWEIISDTLGKDSSTGSLALEYKSGKGTFAKMFNGGRPFVDDLIIEPSGNVFEFRSSSRVGDSDL